jgi:hypothetical protein
MSRSSIAHLLEGSEWESDDEDKPTSQFSAWQLRELVSRSTEKSTMLADPPERSGIELVVPRPECARESSTPGFLAKSSAVLVLPEAPVPPPPTSAVRLIQASDVVAPTAVAPTVVAPTVVAPTVVAPIAALAVPRPDLSFEAAPRRTRIKARQGFIQRRLVALALLGAVVACQPWWWNVGDVRGRTSAAAARR